MSTCCRFFEALQADDQDAVTSLLNDDHFKGYVRDEDRLALAFIQVVLMNNIGMLQVLEGYGVDLMGTDYFFEENGVMHAVRYGHTEMLSYLLSAGVNVNQQSKNGSTALHVAVENVQYECLQVLVLQRGVDLNIQDVSGLSPFLWAAKLRDWKAMEILITAGCNIESTDYRNRVNALHICVDGEKAFWKGKIVTARDTINCIDLLIDTGIDINSLDIHGNTALIYAVTSSNFPAVKHLLKLNCDLECSGKHSQITTSYFHFPHVPDQVSVVGIDMKLLPLYMALSKLRIRTARMLCVAGTRYHKLAREPNIFTYIDKNKPLRKYFEEIVFTPMSLQHCCKLKIRKCIGQGISEKVRNLEIPEKLKDFVLLKELDTM